MAIRSLVVQIASVAMEGVREAFDALSQLRVLGPQIGAGLALLLAPWSGKREGLDGVLHDRTARVSKLSMRLCISTIWRAPMLACAMSM